MLFKVGKWRAGVIVLLLLMTVAVGLTSVGCVQGLQSVGWSGGMVSGGKLYVGSSEGKLVSVNLSDEGRLWSERLKSSQSGGMFSCVPTTCGGTSSAGVAVYGTPAVSGGLVYIGGYNGKVYAFTSDNLTTRWVYPREGYLEDDKNKVVSIVGGLVVADGRLYFGGSDGTVYALDAATGDPLWDYPTGDKIWGTPAVSGDTLFIGSFDKKLYALGTDGGKKWEFATQGAIYSTPLVQDGTVYFGSFDRYLYAVNAADGSLKWKFQGENWFWAQPLLYGDTLYAGCLDGKVYALKAATGEPVKDFTLDSPVSSTPVVVGSSVIFASRKGIVYGIDTGSGELRHLADVGAEIYGPLCASESIVYIHAQNLTLYRLNAATGELLRSISLKSTG